MFLAEAQGCVTDSFHHEGHEDHEEVKGTAHRAVPIILGSVSGYPIWQLTEFHSS